MKSKIVTENGKRYQVVPYADKEHGGTTVNFLVPMNEGIIISKTSPGQCSVNYTRRLSKGSKGERKA